jgi:hypothetical protein
MKLNKKERSKERSFLNTKTKKASDNFSLAFLFFLK